MRPAIMSLPYATAMDVARDLAAAGLKHYLEQAGDQWVITVDDQMEMEDVEALIAICKRHGLTFWIGRAIELLKS
jgi:hypothetical protein